MWPNDTQPNGFQICDRQMTHYTQPNGYQMFDRQQTDTWPNDTEQMVIECLSLTDDTSYTAKWLSNILWTDTQPNGYQMFDRQTCGQITCSEMVFECLIDR